MIPGGLTGKDQSVMANQIEEKSSQRHSQTLGRKDVRLQGGQPFGFNDFSRELSI